MAFLSTRIPVANYPFNVLILIPHIGMNNKPMKGKALWKHSLHEKTAASVLLKPFISSNE